MRQRSLRFHESHLDSHNLSDNHSARQRTVNFPFHGIRIAGSAASRASKAREQIKEVDLNGNWDGVRRAVVSACGLKVQRRVSSFVVLIFDGLFVEDGPSGFEFRN